MRPRALVVGGTGMMRVVSLELAARGHAVTVLARRHTRLAALAADAPMGTIWPLALDYHDTGALERVLAQATRSGGPFGLAVVWIHGSAPNAPSVVARFVQGDYYHVLGSAAADPGRHDGTQEEGFIAWPGARYHQVILGFVQEDGRSRWLTHEEIGRGVLAAVEEGSSRTVVGTVEPWFARP